MRRFVAVTDGRSTSRVSVLIRGARLSVRKRDMTCFGITRVVSTGDRPWLRAKGQSTVEKKLCDVPEVDDLDREQGVVEHTWRRTVLYNTC